MSGHAVCVTDEKLRPRERVRVPTGQARHLGAGAKPSIAPARGSQQGTPDIGRVQGPAGAPHWPLAACTLSLSKQRPISKETVNASQPPPPTDGSEVAKAGAGGSPASTPHTYPDSSAAPEPRRGRCPGAAGRSPPGSQASSSCPSPALWGGTPQEAGGREGSVVRDPGPSLHLKVPQVTPGS